MRVTRLFKEQQFSLMRGESPWRKKSDGEIPSPKWAFILSNRYKSCAGVLCTTEGPAIYLVNKRKRGSLLAFLEQKWTHEHVLFWKHFGLSIKNRSGVCCFCSWQTYLSGLGISSGSWEVFKQGWRWPWESHFLRGDPRETTPPHSQQHFQVTS